MKENLENFSGDKFFVSIIPYFSTEIERDLISTEIKRETSLIKEPVESAIINHLLTEKFRGMALNNDHGKILCIGVICERFSGKVFARKLLGLDKMRKRLLQDESCYLSEFWRLLEDFDPFKDRIIGHDIFDFNLLLLQKRSIINRIRIRPNLQLSNYQSQAIYDTLREWEIRGRGRAELCEIAKALGLFTSGTAKFEESKTHEYLQAGRHREIADNCFRQVILVRQVYHHMVVN